MIARTLLLTSLLLASGCAAQTREPLPPGQASPTRTPAASATQSDPPQNEELREAGEDSARKQAEAEALLRRGEIRKARDLMRKILYGARTVNSKTWGAKFLRAAHEHALAAFQAGKAEEASELMETAFQSSGGLVSLTPEDITGEAVIDPPTFILDENLYEKDFAAQLPRAEYVEIAGDYGLFLEQAGDKRKDVKVLEQAVQMAPDREAVRLAFADALWKHDEKEKSAREYRAYLDLMASKKQLDKVPPRANERVKN
jgi:tetratricopeptide (TPR) repeat protein